MERLVRRRNITSHAPHLGACFEPQRDRLLLLVKTGESYLGDLQAAPLALNIYQIYTSNISRDGVYSVQLGAVGAQGL